MTESSLPDWAFPHRKGSSRRISIAFRNCLHTQS